MPLYDVVKVTVWFVLSLPFQRMEPPIVMFLIVEFHVYSASGL